MIEGPRATGTRSWFQLLALPVLAVGLAAFLLVSVDAQLCSFANITGVPCPGCGMTRATRELVNGNWGAAHKHHPLVLLVPAPL